MDDRGSQHIRLCFPWPGRYRFPDGFSFRGLDQVAADEAIRSAFEAANNKLRVPAHDQGRVSAQLSYENREAPTAEIRAETVCDDQGARRLQDPGLRMRISFEDA
jgi:hypothetical protein